MPRHGHRISHWRDGLGVEDWSQVGVEHLDIYRGFARALALPTDPGVIIEWGCGGGANAVVFAPLATKFIAADVSADSVAECVKQVRSVCDTPVEAITVDIDNPEEAVAGRTESCDVFLCVYVIELAASAEEAMRIVDIAAGILRPGGMALFQVKYNTADRSTRGRKRNYRRNVANMTTFGIDEFWLRASQTGLTPRLITLVPKNHLDVRYAYYALTKA